jgi:hypothetical protein
LVNGLARIVVLSAAFFIFAFGQGFAAAEGDNGVVGTRWLTGPQLERQLSVSAELTFVDRPFRAALRSVSTTFGLGLVLDRRIDPDQLVSFQGKSRPLGRILEELAAAHDAEVVWLGPVGYVAPQGKGWQVLAAAELCEEQVSLLPASRREAWNRLAPCGWPDFSVPRELLVQTLNEVGWQLSNPQALPHDLWAGVELPPLSLPEKLALITVQFDLRAVLDPPRQEVRLEPIDPSLSWRRTYPLPPKASANWEILRRKIPSARVERAGNRLVVFGPWAAHQQVLEWLKVAEERPVVSPRVPAERRYTIREARGRLESVLQQLATALGLELRLDYEALARAGISPLTPISFSVQEATLEELLRTATSAAGCDYRLEGKVLYVFPAKR